MSGKPLRGISVKEEDPNTKIGGDLAYGLGANLLKSFLFVSNYYEVLNIFFSVSALLGITNSDLSLRSLTESRDSSFEEASLSYASSIYLLIVFYC